MDQSLVALSEADQKTLAAARQQNSRATPVSYDSIKLKDSEKEVLDVDGNPLPRGQWYIESYGAAKREKSYRCIGANPEIVIIHRCYTYSWYKDGEGLMAWTSDIQDLSEYGHVTLFAKQDGKVTIDFQGPYKPEFKAHMEKHYVVTDSTDKASTAQLTEAAWQECGTAVAANQSDAKLAATLADPYSGFAKIVGDIRKLLEHKNAKPLLDKAGLSIHQVNDAEIWTTALRDRRNALHWGKAKSFVADHAETGTLLMAAPQHLGTLEAIRAAC